MNTSKKIVYQISFAIVLYLASCSAFAADSLDINKIKSEFKGKIRKYTLKNGLRVILMKNETSPTIACYMKIGVGSANEPFDLAGTAHFLEHLLFKGTDKMGTLDYKREKMYLRQMEVIGSRLDSYQRKLEDPLLSKKKREQYTKKKDKFKKQLKMLESLSSDLILSEEDSKVYSLAGQVGYNAYTSADVTNYQVKLPKNRLELWAFMESERLRNPVFREFYPEREVILEERRMRYDSKPKALLYELFNKTAFGFSPYGKPIIGFKSNILKLTEPNTRKFFNANYIPSRIVITIVGDIDFEKARVVLNKYFSRLEAKIEPDFPPIEFEEPVGRKTAVLSAESTPLLMTGWIKPEITSSENPAYDVLERILAGGKSSRLIKKLVIEKKLATYVGTHNGLPGNKLKNQFALFIAPYSHKKYTEVYKLIKSEFNAIAKNGVDTSELEKAKNQILAEVIKSLASNGGMADALSYYELLFHNYEAFFNYVEEIQNVTNEDIVKIVKKTFVDKNNTTVWIQPVKPNDKIR